MIFSVPGHIEKIIDGTKTQTRRKSPNYSVGHSYAISKGREKAIKEGRILITKKRVEKFSDWGISVSDAIAEGGYTSGQFEIIFANIYPGWILRYAYTFRFIPNQQYRSTKL